ncbi:hypothetical protein CEXT_133241 [Caerostris extrusa]|uniref:Uncharacterized protein n=1 Tax=Caerostris extrusa TaxID=172846 RepID=A0AAV4UUV4_CAEEX|nr:hypothetical protein CEXT_133241 [Caerostris extrusa]
MSKYLQFEFRATSKCHDVSKRHSPLLEKFSKSDLHASCCKGRPCRQKDPGNFKVLRCFRENIHPYLKRLSSSDLHASCCKGCPLQAKDPENTKLNTVVATLNIQTTSQTAPPTGGNTPMLQIPNNTYTMKRRISNPWMAFLYYANVTNDTIRYGSWLSQA